METYRSNAVRCRGLTLLATAIAPIPMASFAGQPSSSIGVAFLKSYTAICLEGCIKMSDRLVWELIGLG